MDIMKGQKLDLSDILSLISKCVKHMQSQGLYQWDELYPNSDIIESDLNNEDAYVLKDDGKCIAYVAINEEQSPEYSQVNWHTDGRKVLVIHRLCVHPKFQSKGIAKQMITFCEEMAMTGGYTCIRLDTYSKNQKALKLYEYLDYQKSGQVFFPFKPDPFYCFEKSINDNL